jgi:hypothetical protein
MLLASVTACSNPMPDPEAREKVVQDYISAVQAGDRQRLAELVSPRVEAAAEIDAKVRTIGGKRWNSISINWHEDEFPMAAAADIVAVDDSGQAVKDTVELGKADDRWYVGLGTAPDAGTPASTESPAAL